MGAFCGLADADDARDVGVIVFVMRPRLIAGFAALSTILVAVALRFNWWEALRGGFGWRWLYSPMAIDQLLPLLIVTASYVVIAYLLLLRDTHARWLVAWSVVGGAALGIAAVYVQSHGEPFFELFARAAAPVGTGPHWMAANIAWENGEWRDWVGIMARFGGHLSNLPPGSILAYAGLAQLFDAFPALAQWMRSMLLPLQCTNSILIGYSAGTLASASLGMSMPILAALGPVLLLPLARRHQLDPRPLVLIYPLVPAFIAFAGSWNTVYPLFALGAFLCLAIAVDARRQRAVLGWALAAGVVSGLGVFFNFALIPLPLFMGLYVLLRVVVDQRGGVLQAFVIGLAVVAGFGIPWIIWLAVGGQSLLTILMGSLSFHMAIEREYLPWLALHAWDWILWNGLPLVVIMIVGTIGWIARSRGKAASAFPVWTTVLIVGLGVLLLSGTARGETGRVWTFITPVLLLSAGEMHRHTRDDRLMLDWLVLAGAQGALLVALVSTIPTMGTDWEFPQPPELIQVENVENAVFAGEPGAGSFRLIGWDADVSNDTVRLHLLWEGLRPSERLVWFGAVMVGNTGSSFGSEPRLPGTVSAYPTTCWREGQYISDTMVLPITDASDTEWWVSLSGFAPDISGDQPLSVSRDGVVTAQVGIGPIRR